MNPNKPSQIFAKFKDQLITQLADIQKIKKDSGFYSDPKKSQAYKTQLMNAERGVEILSTKNLQHFMLPLNGQLMDDHLMEKPFAEIITKYLQGQRLPFPQITIEFETDAEGDETKDVKNLNSLLVVQNILSDGEDEPYLKIEAIHELSIMDKKALFTVPETFILDLNAERIASRSGLCTYYIDENGEQKILNENINNAYSTISKVIALLVALSCKNIGLNKTNTPSIKQNQKLQKQGLTTHKTYNFIVVDTNSHYETIGDSSASSGSKKTTHVRRGHVRHYENKNVWIEQTVINANKADIAQKIYKVK